VVERIESDVSLTLHLGLLETHPPKPIALKGCHFGDDPFFIYVIFITYELTRNHNKNTGNDVDD
jgi:hypothetical protein